MRSKIFFYLLLCVVIGCTACTSSLTNSTQTPIQKTQGFQSSTSISSSTVIPAPTTTNQVTSTLGGPFTVTDDLGREVTFDKAPQRIVLAGKALLMVADAIYTFPGAADKIVAIGPTKQGSYDFIPMVDPAYASKITLSGTPTAEDIAAANPDCVISNSSNASSLEASLEALKIPVVFLDFETPDHYQGDLKTLGQIFQTPDRANVVAAYYQNKVDSITSTLSSLTDAQKPKTLLLYYNVSNNTTSFNIPPSNWMQTIMVETAGGTPVWKDANPGSGWATVTIEQIAAWNPEDIFIVSYFQSVDDVIKQLKADPEWQALDAVKNNKLYGFVTDVYSWDESDSRWILGLTWMAGKLHPDLFPTLDIIKEAQDFYQELYGIDSATYQQKIQPLMIGDYK